MISKFSYKIFTLVMVIVFAISSTGCQLFQKDEDYLSDFDAFAEILALSMMASTEVSVQQYFFDRSAYGIENTYSNWGDMNIEQMQSSYDSLQELYEHLLYFDYDALSPDQQNTFNLFRVYLEGELSVRDHFLLEEILAPQMGIHAMIPFRLTLYTFENKDELERYLNVVKDVEKIITDCVDYQIARSDAGLFMREDYVQWVIDECIAIIENAQFLFADNFEARINAVDWLTEEEKSHYIDLNHQYIIQNIVPAYQELSEVLETLKHTGTEGMGLHRFDGGTEYYLRQLQRESGTDRSPEALFDVLNTHIDEWVLEANEIRQQLDYNVIVSTFEEYTNPQQIIDMNLNQMEGRFPSIEDMPEDFYAHTYIPIFMEGIIDGLYMFTTYDYPWNNAIYYSRYSEGYSFYQVISHEAMPGHLYQTVYFLTSDTSNKALRYLLMTQGEGRSTYEGWATYIEGLCLESAGLPEWEARYICLENNIMYAVLAAVDIGIHYYKWTEEDVKLFLSDKNVDSWMTFNEYLYQIIDTNPAMHLPYAMGYIDLTEMLYRAQNELGDTYSEYEFHRFYLENSSLTMDIIKELFEEWLEDQKEFVDKAA